MPDIFYDSQESIPEGLREHAVKGDDGKFKVAVAPAAKVTEFRDNNVALLQERDSLKAALEGYTSVVGDDLDGFKTNLAELREVHQQVKDGTLKGSTAIQAEVDTRVKSVREGFETQLQEAANKVKEASARGDKFEGLFKQSVRDQAITNAVVAQDSGANPQALPDLLARAATIFSVNDDGKLIPKKGETVIYGSDGATPMTPTEWLAKELETSPYLRKPSAGGGATGGTDKAEQYGGLSEKEFLALSPQRRMQMAREAQAKR